MKPRRKQPKVAKPRPEEKQKRFRLIKLEERITPKKGSSNDSVFGTTLSIE
jgi:hypothetical protein